MCTDCLTHMKPPTHTHTRRVYVCNICMYPTMKKLCMHPTIYATCTINKVAL